MSEHHPTVPEQGYQPEHEHRIETPTETGQSDGEIEAERQETLAESRELIEEHAAKTDSINVGEVAPEPVNQLVATRDLQDMAYQRALVRNRKQMSKPSRALSKVIHQPVVDAISRASENTIARPSGLLVGGAVALIGSSILLYTAKHYGFRYNFLAFALLFVGGFVLGLALELVYRLFKHWRSS
jgi:hypothetical protein